MYSDRSGMRMVIETRCAGRLKTNVRDTSLQRKPYRHSSPRGRLLLPPLLWHKPQHVIRGRCEAANSNHVGHKGCWHEYDLSFAEHRFDRLRLDWPFKVYEVQTISIRDKGLLLAVLDEFLARRFVYDRVNLPHLTNILQGQGQPPFHQQSHRDQPKSARRLSSVASRLAGERNRESRWLTIHYTTPSLRRRSFRKGL
jgi:hypothetical protein